MSSLSREFAAADIGVHWDVEDCPIPSGLTPDSIYENIKHALKKLGYCGSLSITAYSGLHRNEDDFKSAGIELKPIGAKHARVDKILKDVYVWGMRHRKEASNLMVISRDLSADVGYVSAFGLLKTYENNILLAQPCNASGELLDIVSSVWLWPSLSVGGSPLYDHQSPSSQGVGNTFACSGSSKGVTPSPTPLRSGRPHRVAHKKHRTKPYHPKRKSRGAEDTRV